MSIYLDELYGHQAWADAEHWRAFEAHPPALADRAIRERLFHIHQVQQIFLWLVGPRTSEFVFNKVEDYARMADLKAEAQKYHALMGALLAGIDETRMEQIVEIPWSKTPLTVKVRHALMQAAMHSHYHRAQNATRLRELGGVPPTTDFITWVRNGQPAAVWE
jgi:uncharacterized damage-inducible protein DinB